MATPVSSRINWVGDRVEAVLSEPLALSPQSTLPAGSLMKGRVAAVKLSARNKPGSIRLQFTLASPLPPHTPFIAQINTPDGWLRQTDENTNSWTVSPLRSTRLLNQKIQQRLGSDRAVWASVLGLNQNTIPAVESDRFMRDYNRNDVMVGAGDRLQLQLLCP
ncbi:hypothetical protein [Vampirovibrio sp.]|uniref:hypothetical protein n=1 Tax=Vampirovibrio sp. TaxID=2717857 RepID=UPI003594708E